MNIDYEWKLVREELVQLVRESGRISQKVRQLLSWFAWAFLGKEGRQGHLGPGVEPV